MPEIAQVVLHDIGIESPKGMRNRVTRRAHSFLCILHEERKEPEFRDIADSTDRRLPVNILAQNQYSANGVIITYRVPTTSALGATSMKSTLGDWIE